MTNRRMNNDAATPDTSPENDLTTEERERLASAETVEEQQTAAGETNNIVYRQPVTNPDGTPGVKEHGPMPVDEWADYEKENKL